MKQGSTPPTGSRLTWLLRLLPALLILAFLPAAASAQCTYTFTFAPPGPITLDPAGGSGSILLNSQPGCGWTAVTTSPWITVNTPSGTGTAQVTLTYQVNATGEARTGTIIIQGITINLTQASSVSCSYSFNFTPPGPVVVDPAGGLGSIALNTLPACAWTASSTTPWVTVISGGGTGTAQVVLSFQVNDTGAARTGTVVIQGTTINLTQAPTALCTYVFTPSGSVTLDPSGGAGAIVLTTQPGCPWTASTSTPWVNLVTARGNGNSQIAFLYQVNNTGLARTGAIVIQNTTIALVQPPTTASQSVSPMLLNFSYRVGDPVPAAQALNIAGLGTGGQARTFAVDSPTVSWIAVSPIGGAAPSPTGAVVGVSVFPGGLLVGTYNTTLTVRLSSENISVNIPVTLTVQSPTSAVNTNQVVPHIADSQGWQTTIILLNVDLEPAPYSLRFYGSQSTGRFAGTPMDMAFVGLAGRTSLVEGTIPVGGSRIIQTAGTDPLLNIGWVDLATTKKIVGTGVFRDNNARQEAAVALTTSARAFVLPFDNTQGQVTSYAIVNTNPSQTITATATVRDENGVTLATLPIALQSRGHAATETNTQFPASANQRGSIEFRTTNADITGLGFRFAAITPGTSRPFTSFPIQPIP